jgi:hypothetical protein
MRCGSFEPRCVHADVGRRACRATAAGRFTCVVAAAAGASEPSAAGLAAPRPCRRPPAPSPPRPRCPTPGGPAPKARQGPAVTPPSAAVGPAAAREGRVHCALAPRSRAEVPARPPDDRHARSISTHTRSRLALLQARPSAPPAPSFVQPAPRAAACAPAVPPAGPQRSHDEPLLRALSRMRFGTERPKNRTAIDGDGLPESAKAHLVLLQARAVLRRVLERQRAVAARRAPGAGEQRRAGAVGACCFDSCGAGTCAGG